MKMLLIFIKVGTDSSGEGSRGDVAMKWSSRDRKRVFLSFSRHPYAIWMSLWVVFRLGRFPLSGWLGIWGRNWKTQDGVSDSINLIKLRIFPFISEFHDNLTIYWISQTCWSSHWTRVLNFGISTQSHIRSHLHKATYKSPYYQFLWKDPLLY